MNSDERKDLILNYLQEKKKVKIIEISSKLKVSRETVRKDLYELEEAGLIKKVHGGAVLDESNKESMYDKRRDLNEHEKDLIAEVALNFVEDGDTIYLDYGTTTYKLAEKLIRKKDLTVVTNTLPIIKLLLEHDGIDIVIPGGRVRRNEFSLLGPTALEVLENIYVDIGFFGCGGINVSSGVTNYYEDEVEISKKMINHSSQSIVLADFSKIGITAYKKTADFSDIDVLITNSLKNIELKNDLEANDVKLIET